ncbi:hypothetical protein CC1G_10043 [Coprinopsis cinerea okayama7|uniref:Uncharacterized protein n=1 Tax=Coprinopsis cinerea (strain Okayama-7 / 130 / ATCC MYA-4618 / FGSC 9003) TaxID=240176 RepID=A8NUW5_COPC7|nr:hypothetical protein CC1G_10043 [Coprinopsis cinerea okayama7\|eukprot:XP_001836549.2 hypothetical protein CC1G_10043 [Coprinopsis cinerea okayama7\
MGEALDYYDDEADVAAFTPRTSSGIQLDPAAIGGLQILQLMIMESARPNQVRRSQEETTGYLDLKPGCISR